MMGLTIGLFVQNMANPRMGLSAHLEGIMNGLFLMLVGVVWHKFSLSPKWLTTSYWLLIYSTFANVLAVLIAAITGAGKMMPLEGGQEGGAGLETTINFLLISLSLALLFACTVLTLGYYRFMHQKLHEMTCTTH
ncbi:Hydroxylaminobenzene mutase hab [Lunatimonas lonarensis]|uniref:Hydroxylaminobenzene mutase hab n=2 Tax=Lunatimonas lonarensis TaxID=1232681 RepID=R7ZSN1_9BACT|nr:Hydroxylaminobenzene mutase hab [Lunatimonas lonarensis]